MVSLTLKLFVLWVSEELACRLHDDGERSLRILLLLLLLNFLLLFLLLPVVMRVWVWFLDVERVTPQLLFGLRLSLFWDRDSITTGLSPDHSSQLTLGDQH